MSVPLSGCVLYVYVGVVGGCGCVNIFVYGKDLTEINGLASQISISTGVEVEISFAITVNKISGQ